MLKKELLISDYMTSQPYSIEPDATLEAAKKLMIKYAIRHLPVLKNGKVVGILSDRDVKLVEGFEDDDLAEICVADVCISNPYVVEPHTPLEKVAKTMAAKHYGSAIVVKAGKLSGIFTTVDACRALAQTIRF